MMNLLRETIDIIEENGKTYKDVRWVGSNDFCFTWDEFAAVASVEYDEGYGAPNVAEDLVIVGDDWWLERGEYDGSEWWEYKTTPRRPSRRMSPSSLIANDIGWEKLIDIEMGGKYNYRDDDRAKWLEENTKPID